MNRTWDRLTWIMERHLEFHQTLLSMAQEKTDVLIANEVDALLGIVGEEDAIIKKIHTLEEERKQILERLGQKDDDRFNHLLEKAPHEKKEELRGLREDLLHTLNELKEKNERNAILINESLELNEFSIQLFTSGQQSQAYGPGDRKKREVSYRIFDEKA